MNRRQFLQTTAAGTAALATARGVKAGLPLSNPKAEPRVTLARDTACLKNSQVDESRVGLLLDRALREQFDCADPIEVFRQNFSPKDRVGIKVNCLSGQRLSTHVELVNAIAGRLQKAGVKPENILIWDRLNSDLRKAGYTLSPWGKPVSCCGCDVLGYERELTLHRSIGSFFTKAVTELCTAQINVPVLKDHGIVGVTLGMKNFFGAIHNPNKYHPDHGDPYVADLYSHPDIGGKVKLTIVDALEVQPEGGPPFQPNWCQAYGGLMISDDPVALDRIGWTIIERMRREKGLPTLVEAKREPTYIHTAAQLGLGTDELARIQFREV